MTVRAVTWWRAKELTRAGKVSYVLVSNVVDGVVHFFAHDAGHPEGKQHCTRLLSKWHEKYEEVSYAEVPEGWGRHYTPHPAPSTHPVLPAPCPPSSPRYVYVSRRNWNYLEAFNEGAHELPEWPGIGDLLVNYLESNSIPKAKETRKKTGFAKFISKVEGNE